MKHWHKCRRWTERGIICPFGEREDHGPGGGLEDDTTTRPPVTSPGYAQRKRRPEVRPIPEESVIPRVVPPPGIPPGAVIRRIAKRRVQRADIDIFEPERNGSEPRTESPEQETPAERPAPERRKEPLKVYAEAAQEAVNGNVQEALSIDRTGTGGASVVSNQGVGGGDRILIKMAENLAAEEFAEGGLEARTSRQGRRPGGKQPAEVYKGRPSGGVSRSGGPGGGRIGGGGGLHFNWRARLMRMMQ